jgi:hypothetical protein
MTNKAATSTKPEMSVEDINVIRRLAAITPAEAKDLRNQPPGPSNLRTQAIDIYRRHIGTLGCRGTPEMQFMSEVDNPCPDIGLRASYRKTLLELDGTETK